MSLIVRLHTSSLNSRKQHLMCQNFKESKLAYTHTCISLPLSRYETLLKEKEELETAYEALQEEMEEMLREGGGSDRASNKDTRTLKKIIKNMEVDEKN